MHDALDAGCRRRATAYSCRQGDAARVRESTAHRPAIAIITTKGRQMKRMFSNGRYANVTATLALIVALGGTSYAAVILPRNSVGSKQLKKGAVTNSKLRTSAVTSGEVRNGSLRAKDFKAGQLPAGPLDPPGQRARRSCQAPASPRSRRLGRCRRRDHVVQPGRAGAHRAA